MCDSILRGKWTHSRQSDHLKCHSCSLSDAVTDEDHAVTDEDHVWIWIQDGYRISDRNYLPGRMGHSIDM